jgi:hypothetical protein
MVLHGDVASSSLMAQQAMEPIGVGFLVGLESRSLCRFSHWRSAFHPF